VSVIIVVPSDLTSAAWAVVHLGSWFVVADADLLQKKNTAEWLADSD
jgi:hypothetical protein